MAALSVGALFSAAQAQTGTGAFPGVDPVAIEDLVLANHILANEKVLDGFGHVSIRDPRNPNRYLMSRSVAPATVTTSTASRSMRRGAAPTRSASSTARSTRCGRTSTPSSTVTLRPLCPSP
jgi:hypothetical protein